MATSLGICRRLYKLIMRSAAPAFNDARYAKRRDVPIAKLGRKTCDTLIGTD